MDYDYQMSLALSKLNIFKMNKVQLQRPVFFVPGWTDEAGAAWRQPFKGRPCVEQWFKDVVANSELALFVDFSAETTKCKSFLDFGEALKAQVRRVVKEGDAFDLVGYSMGGLDIRAALAQGDALSGCHSCITLAAPHQGCQLGGFTSWRVNWWQKLINVFKPMMPYHKAQSQAMDPDYPEFKKVNTIGARRLFLENVKCLHMLKGTRDTAVMGSAVLDKIGIESLYQQKTQLFEIEGCAHTGDDSITRDPRAIFLIIAILCGLPIELERNYGNLAGGIYKPGDEKQSVV